MNLLQGGVNSPIAAVLHPNGNRYRSRMKCLTLVVLIALFSSVPAVAQMHEMSPMPAHAVESAAPGASVTFVARVDAIKRSTITAKILERVTGNTYRATGDTIAIYAPESVSVAMGSRDDLKPGAVVYVYATATKPHAADASKLVVMTPYVSIR